MNTSENLSVSFHKTTSEIVSQTIQNLVQGLTGIASSERKDVILSIGHVLQRLRAGHFLSAFLKEWEEFKEKGKIKDDYQYTEQHYNCFQELLDFLDKDLPDEVRFSVLKKIFLVAASEEDTNRDSCLPVQYMQICRNLKSGEVIILKTVFNIANDNDSWAERHWSADDWLEKIAQDSGLKFKELVASYEDELIQKNLISLREHVDDSGVSIRPYFRLTSLGYELCKYIELYDEKTI